MTETPAFCFGREPSPPWFETYVADGRVEFLRDRQGEVLCADVHTRRGMRVARPVGDVISRSWLEAIAGPA